MTSTLLAPAPRSARATRRLARRVRWRYHFTDMRSGALLATLPCRDVRLSESLNGPSDGAAVVPLNDRTIGRDPFGATVPRRTVLWAERQELDADTGRAVVSDIPWSGLVRSRERDRTGRTLALGLVTWEAYWQSRLVQDRAFVQADRFAVMRQLAEWGSRQLDGTVPPHLAPVITGDALSGDLIDRTYEASLLKPVLEAAKDLASSGLGFDWRLVPYRDTDDAATFRLRLDLGYPRLGRVAPPDLVWSSVANDARAGQLLNYKITEDGSNVYNRVTALGEGTGPTQLRSVVVAGDVGRDEELYGFPLYETSLSTTTGALRTQETLDAHARGAMLAGLASEVRLSGIEVRGDLAPVLTSYAVGDDGTFRIGDQVTGHTTTIVGQIVARTITPAQQGRTERVTMDVQGSVAG